MAQHPAAVIRIIIKSLDDSNSDIEIQAGQSSKAPVSKGKRPRNIGKEKKRQGSMAKRWTFTLNKYTDTDIKHMEKECWDK